MIYKLEYLPLAQKDMVEILSYISHELKNPIAATRLGNRMVESAERILLMPYMTSVYVSISPLKNEYRKLLIDNYIMFYYVSEKTKVVTIVRVIYARKNYENLLD